MVNLIPALGYRTRYHAQEMRLRYIAITIGWILTFVVGTLVTTFLVSIYYHRYDDHGIGNYYGAIHGNFTSFIPDTYLKFDAESPKAFRFAPPTTYTYGSLELTIINESGKTMQGKLHVPRMEFVTETERQIVSEDLLSRWLLGPDYSKHDDAETVAGLYSLLQSAGSGAFARPRHHPYEIPPFLPPEEGRKEKREAGSFVHFSCGYRVPHLPVYWTAICLVGWAFHMVNRVITIRCTRSRGPRGFFCLHVFRRGPVNVAVITLRSCQMKLPEKHDRLSASIASDVVFNNLRCEVACYGSANDFVCRITRQHLKPVAAEWNDGYLPPSNAGMLWIRSIDHQCLITGFVHKWLFPNSTDLDNGLDLIQQMLTVDQGQSKVNVTVIGANANQIYEFDGETMGTDYN